VDGKIKEFSNYFGDYQAADVCSIDSSKRVYAFLKKTSLEHIIANADEKCRIDNFLNRRYTWRGIVRHLLNADLPKNDYTGSGGSATASVHTASFHTASATTTTNEVGCDNLATFNQMHQFAILLAEQGDIDGAKINFTLPLEGREKALGPKHPYTLITENNLAELIKDQEARITNLDKL
jgi:hypothetical protein